MSKINYYEVIEASPAWDEREVAIHVRNFNKVEGHIKAEALRKLLNPSERLQYELDTFHDPDYEAIITCGEKYKGFISFLTGIPGTSFDISPNLTHYLYRAFTKHPSFGNLNGSPNADARYHAGIADALRTDPWMIHSIALLLERCAGYYSEQGDYRTSAEVTKRSLEYWAELFGYPDFYKSTYAYKKIAGTPKENICLEVWNSMQERLLDGIFEQFSRHLESEDFEKALIDYNTIGNMSTRPSLSSTALRFMDRMQSCFIRSLDAIFLRGKVKTGFSGDYDAVFNNLHMFYSRAGNAERLLLYETEKSSGQLFELKTSKSFEIAWRRLPELKSLEERLQTIKIHSDQSFVIDQQIKGMYDTLQDVAVECANSGKYRMSLEIFKALPRERMVPVGQNEKKTISEILIMIENLAITSGDFWSPNGTTWSKPYTPPQPPYYPQPGSQPDIGPTASNGSGRYAGFWRRLFALAIDCFAVWLITIYILSPLLISVVDIKGSVLCILAVYWIYFARMESSGLQGTIGKKILGIKVTDLNGGRISFGNATGRFFSRAVSAVLLFAGFLMAATTPNKQALHDVMAGTLVVKN